MTVLDFDPARRTNAHLIADVAALGYLRDEDLVLDTTFGLGRFWAQFRPLRLVACDLDPSRVPAGGLVVDFTDLPFADGTFDVVVFDPPYKLNGRAGSHASDAGYGVATTATAAERLGLIGAGLVECIRVAKVGGALLVKCQDQVVSGRKTWQRRIVANAAEALGCVQLDELYVTGHRPQPPGRRQVHSRSNSSALLVLRKSASRRAA